MILVVARHVSRCHPADTAKVHLVGELIEHMTSCLLQICATQQVKGESCICL